jgi:uncharacterized protein (UPF0147 family)
MPALARVALALNAQAATRLKSLEVRHASGRPYHLFVALGALGFRGGLAPAEAFNGAGGIGFRPTADYVRATNSAGPVTAALAFAALHAADIVAKRSAPRMLRTINRASAVARAIRQSAGQAKGKLEGKNDQQAKNQSHDELLYEVNGGRCVPMAHSLTSSIQA